MNPALRTAGAALHPAAWLAARLRPLVQRLPMQPPTLALTLALDKLLLPNCRPMHAKRCPAGRSRWRSSTWA